MPNEPSSEDMLPFEADPSAAEAPLRKTPSELLAQAQAEVAAQEYTNTQNQARVAAVEGEQAAKQNDNWHGLGGHSAREVLIQQARDGLAAGKARAAKRDAVLQAEKTAKRMERLLEINRQDRESKERLAAVDPMDTKAIREAIYGPDKPKSTP